MRDRHVVLGVSGGVAAYKAAYLARLLVEEGAEVRTVMTSSATQFLGAQTLAAITGTPVVERLFGGHDVSPHTELGQWADLMIIAPATANTLARLAGGISGDALIATALATEAPMVVAPAMHTEMWQHPSTQSNISRLAQAGCLIVGPGEGELAGGDIGVGRMVDPESIVLAGFRALATAGEDPLAGKRFVITAGGTREAIDPVRFVGNRSSGRMGHAIATEAARRGAEVTLVTTSRLPALGCNVVSVEDAAAMAQVTWDVAAGSDVAILAAAVADFRPKAPATEKLKRSDGVPELILEPTENILSGIAAMDDRPYLIGFAAQTGGIEDAFVKATTYGVDLLVANDITEAGSGFGTETNRVTVIAPDGTAEEWPLQSKEAVARGLLDRIAAVLPR